MFEMSQLPGQDQGTSLASLSDAFEFLFVD
jgi:hypothetical protein